MTSKQKELARHALGLPNSKGMSYRNHYATDMNSPESKHLMALVKSGMADVIEADTDRTLFFFHLTKSGAMAALNEHEKLCPEDFPEATK